MNLHVIGIMYFMSNSHFDMCSIVRLCLSMGYVSSVTCFFFYFTCWLYLYSILPNCAGIILSKYIIWLLFLILKVDKIKEKHQYNFIKGTHWRQFDLYGKSTSRRYKFTFLSYIHDHLFFNIDLVWLII